MSFTLTFSSPLGSVPITITTSESITIVFDTTDGGTTYTFTSSTGTITVLDGFNGQTWSANLSTVSNIPTSVTTIGGAAFFFCTSLSSITIPTSVTTIRFNAFDSCFSLSSITIPSSVTTIRSTSFRNCTSLVSIGVDSSNTNYSSLDGNLYNKTQTTLITYAIGKTDTSFTIPSSVTTIDQNAFNSCSSLSLP